MIDELIQGGQLVKTSPDLKKAEKSLTMAADKIERARQELDAGIYDNALVSAYTAMFHAARALLFMDGFKERNHYAIYVYVKERYEKKLGHGYINELNVLRTIRHKVIYGDENINSKEIQQNEAEEAIRIAVGFLGSVKKLIA